MKNVDTPFPFTIQCIRERIVFYKTQQDKLSEALASFGSRKDLIFEVHAQESSPSNRSVMVEDSNLAKALVRARVLEQAHNPRGNHRRLELFVRFGDIRIAIREEDANKMALEAGSLERFHLDSRTVESDGVFRKGDALPSAWYSRVPTPDPKQEAITAA